MKYYTAYGLVFASSIALPELREVAEQEPDVVIQMGDVPNEIEPVMGEGVLYQINETEFRLDVPDIARYYVTRGEQIVVQPYGEDMDQAIRLFLFGSSMGALLQQRGVLPLHASSIVTDAGALAFCGLSGMGKSTLAAFLMRRGYSFVADDISVVSFQEEGEPLVMPSVPYQKLWAATLDVLSIPYTNLERVRSDIEKYNVPILKGFHKEPVPLASVYILSTDNRVTDVHIDDVKGLDKLSVLRSFIYRQHFIIEENSQRYPANLIVQLSHHIRVRRVTRPDGSLDEIEHFVDTIEQDFAT